jgi:hypothetical protein
MFHRSSFETFQIFKFANSLFFSKKGTRGLLPVEELLGDAALEVRLADALHFEDGLTEAGQPVGHADAGTRFWGPPL